MLLFIFKLRSQEIFMVLEKAKAKKINDKKQTLRRGNCRCLSLGIFLRKLIEEKKNALQVLALKSFFLSRQEGTKISVKISIEGPCKFTVVKS